MTGAAGFIGSHVARELQTSGHVVIAVDDLSGGYRDNLPNGVDLHVGSVTDEAFLDELFSSYDIDFVFHLAAYAAEGLSHFIRRFNYMNNVIGSINLINRSVLQEVERFVFTSSIAVYGEGQLPMTEDLQPHPEDPYGIAKYAVELDLEAAHRQFGLEYTIFRPHNVYGEHQNIGDRYRNVVGIFMNQLMRGEPLTVFGDGSQTRAFSYIADVAPVIARSVQIPAAVNQVYNIGADRPCTVNELAGVVAATFGVDPDVRYLPARNEVLHAYSSHKKLKTDFGLPEPTTLEIGVGRMAAWAKSVGARRTPEFQGVEVWRNFPEGWRGAVAES